MSLINFLIFLLLIIGIAAFVKWIVGNPSNSDSSLHNDQASPMISHHPITGMQVREDQTSLDTTPPYNYLTSPFFPTISRLLNKKGLNYNVSHNGNRFIIEFPNNNKLCVVVIETHPVEPLINYKSLIIRDFPDDRLLKLTELIVRLNPHFIYGRFDMLMEERFIIFDMPYRPPFENLDPNRHDYCIQAVIDAWKRCHAIIHDVAFSDTEPVVAMMEFES
jgi:hypothetical protein